MSASILASDLFLDQLLAQSLSDWALLYARLVLALAVLVTPDSVCATTPENPRLLEGLLLTSVTRYFAAGNPARCFGAMVGSHFSSYHWIHWVGPLVAAIAHGVLYACVPPYCRKKATSNAE